MEPRSRLERFPQNQLARASERLSRSAPKPKHHQSVQKIWTRNDLKPHLIRTFEIFKDPRFEAFAVGVPVTLLSARGVSGNFVVSLPFNICELRLASKLDPGIAHCRTALNTFNRPSVDVFPVNHLVQCK